MWIRDIVRLPPEERRKRAKQLDQDLDPFMTALGVVFLLLALSERAAPDGSALAVAFEVVSYVIWAAFIGDFLLRLAIEPDTKKFLKSNWWEIPFLVLPFLRFLRLVRLVRIGRAGRLVSSAVRASRSASAKLQSRLAWFASIHAIVILAAANLVHDWSSRTFADSLHHSALAGTTGEPIPGAAGMVAVVEIGLALYSVAFFAGIAGTLASFYLERGSEARAEVTSAVTRTP